MSRWLIVVLVALTGLLAEPASAQQKVALVIGVSDYKVGGKLPQTLADAEKVAGSLASVGFAVETLAVPALSKGALEDALLAFGERAARADVAVLYFAGHGMQHGDDNWLIPASANLRSEAAIRLEGVALQDVMELMKAARFRIIILDACRNNPFRVNWPQTMDSLDGLGAVPKVAMPVGSLMAFSAASGQKVPNDGVYAEALSRLIREGQGLELNQLMRRVRSEVQRKNPAAAPEYIPNYEGSFSFSGGYDPDASVTAEAAAYKAQVADLQRQLAELRASAAATPAGPARVAKFDLVAAFKAGLEAYNRQDYAEARRQWRAACDAGDAGGCSNLGLMYANGQGVTQDYGQARTFNQKACDAGNAYGCTGLGSLYANGQGVTQDYVQARTLFQKACDAGDATGCSNLGTLYVNGHGVTQDYGQARTYYQKACGAGNAAGCSMLGFLYVSAQGVTQDYGLARAFYQKGCDGGDAIGCSNLGALYANGQSMSLDYVQARTLFKKGCDGGNAPSCSFYGDLVYRGLGGSVDIAAGRALLERGCRAGDSWGCNLLETIDLAR